MGRHLVIGEDSVYEIDDECMKEKYGERGREEKQKDKKVSPSRKENGISGENKARFQQKW